MGGRDDGDPLSAYISEQADAVLVGVTALPDAAIVHRARVATRRLRSTLRVFAPLLDLPPERLAEADRELRWLAGLLGEVRDRQVQRARFAAALDELPPDQVLGPVSARIEGTLVSEQAVAEERLDKAVTTDRYQALRVLLESWRHAPPVSGADPDDVRRRARKAARKATRRLEAACVDGTDEALHRARKAAKRARYAGELVGPLGHGKKQRKRFKHVQRVLGDVQDAVMAEATLRRLVSGVPAGESGFTFGLLHARERETAARAREQACALAGP